MKKCETSLRFLTPDSEHTHILTHFRSAQCNISQNTSPPCTRTQTHTRTCTQTHTHTGKMGCSCQALKQHDVPCFSSWISYRNTHLALIKLHKLLSLSKLCWFSLSLFCCASRRYSRGWCTYRPFPYTCAGLAWLGLTQHVSSAWQ